MCKLGDIISVDEYIGDDLQVIGHHSFVIIDDNKDIIEGFIFDMVATVMSSFKDEKHRIRKLQFEENFEIKAVDTVVVSSNNRDGYTKADQLIYFNKNKIKYTYLGKMDEQVFNELTKRIKMLDAKGKIKSNIENIKDKVGATKE